MIDETKKFGFDSTAEAKTEEDYLPTLELRDSSVVKSEFLALHESELRPKKNRLNKLGHSLRKAQRDATSEIPEDLQTESLFSTKESVSEEDVRVLNSLVLKLYESIARQTSDSFALDFLSRKIKNPGAEDPTELCINEEDLTSARGNPSLSRMVTRMTGRLKSTVDEMSIWQAREKNPEKVSEFLKHYLLLAEKLHLYPNLPGKPEDVLLQRLVNYQDRKIGVELTFIEDCIKAKDVESVQNEMLEYITQTMAFFEQHNVEFLQNLLKAKAVFDEKDIQFLSQNGDWHNKRVLAIMCMDRGLRDFIFDFYQLIEPTRQGYGVANIMPAIRTTVITLRRLGKET